LSQREFATQIGINRERLASYEDARAPLKALIALQLCNQFVVSERWLATGAGYFGQRESEVVPFLQPMARMCMGLIDDKETLKISHNSLFSAAYKEVLGAKYLAYWDSVGLSPRIKISPSDDIGRLQNILHFITTSWIGIGGEENKKRLLYGLIRAGYLLADEVARGKSGPKPGEFEAVIGEEEKTAFAKLRKSAECSMAKNPEFWDFSVNIWEKKDLTKKADSLTNDGVQPVLPKLIQRLRRATEARGSKSELATWLGVHRQCVTDWLSGKQEPGGEITLRLLHWVEQQERQK
jgi:DNA-binding transcriptional regulator YiaG